MKIRNKDWSWEPVFRPTNMYMYMYMHVYVYTHAHMHIDIKEMNLKYSTFKNFFKNLHKESQLTVFVVSCKYISVPKDPWISMYIYI